MIAGTVGKCEKKISRRGQRQERGKIVPLGLEVSTVGRTKMFFSTGNNSIFNSIF